MHRGRGFNSRGHDPGPTTQDGARVGTGNPKGPPQLLFNVEQALREQLVSTTRHKAEVTALDFAARCSKPDKARGMPATMTLVLMSSSDTINDVRFHKQLCKHVHAFFLKRQHGDSDVSHVDTNVDCERHISVDRQNDSTQSTTSTLSST
jgi:hypothetical protein